MRALIAVLFVVAAGCTVTPLPPQPPPEPSPPGGCAAACGRLRQLGCESGAPTAAGTPCETVCAETLAGGLISFDVACLASLVRCEDEPTCARQP